MPAPATARRPRPPAPRGRAPRARAGRRRARGAAAVLVDRFVVAARLAAVVRQQVERLLRGDGHVVIGSRFARVRHSADAGRKLCVPTLALMAGTRRRASRPRDAGRVRLRWRAGARLRCAPRGCARARAPRRRPAARPRARAVDQREHPGARGLRLAAVEVGQRALDPVAQADQRFSSIRQGRRRAAARRRRGARPSHADERVGRPRRPPRLADGVWASGTRSSSVPKPGCGRSSHHQRPGSGRTPAARPSAASSANASQRRGRGGTPWRGSSSAIFGRTEARPVSRPP